MDFDQEGILWRKCSRFSLGCSDIKWRIFDDEVLISNAEHTGNRGIQETESQLTVLRQPKGF